MHALRCAIVLFTLTALPTGLIAQEIQPEPPQADAAGFTTVTFQSDFPVGLFRINSMIIEPSGKSMDMSLSIVEKRMDLLGLSPGVFSLPNGDYVLSVGGNDDFNRMVTLKANGQDRTILVHGDQTLSRVAGIATVVLGMVTFIFSPNLEPLFSRGTVNGPGIIALVSGSLTLAGGIVWGVSSPWVEVK